MKNILVVTTINYNNGDDLIRIGGLNLFEEVYGKDHNYVYFNRNPDLIRVKDCKSNSLTKPRLKNFDMVLVAGSPEWFGYPYYDIYNDLLLDGYKHIPMLMLGIGSADNGYPNLWGMYRSEAVYRENTQIITRDQFTKDIIGREDITVLPCPAIFCSDLNIRERKKPLAIIAQKSNVENHGTTKEIEQQIIQNTPDNADIICFYKEEFFFYNQLFPGRVKFCQEYQNIPYLLSFYKKIISTRLHGAISSLAVGNNTILLTSKNNVRINGAIKLYEDMIPVCHSLEEALNIENYKSFSQIQCFKDSVKRNYLKALKDFKNK